MDDSQALSLVKGRGDPSAYQLAQTTASTSTGPSNASAAAMRNVPAFLNKLFNMVNDPSTDNMIRWTEDGTSFTVPSSEKFGKEMLPRFFKHSNFGSFVRQLNMYGFHKVPHLQQGVLKHDEGEKEKAEILEFRNDYFQRDSPDLLYLIQRKKGSAAAGQPREDSEGPAEGKAPGSSAVASTSKNQSLSKYQGDVTQLMNEVAAIKRHQTLLSTELRELQNSNRQLWQENLQHKAKHDRNQEMIDKILKFLAGVFGGRALNEGTGFTSGNIAAADCMSGLGLNSYGQNATNIGQNRQQDNSSGKVQEQSASPSDSYAMVNVPRKRRRLLLESPNKSGSGQPAKTSSAQPAVSSQFEEIASDEDIPVFEELNGSTGTQSAENSPAQPTLSSFGAINPQEQQRQPPTTSQPSTLPADDFSDIDWPAMTALFSGANNNASGSNNNTNSLYDYTNPSFYNSFSNNLPSQSGPPSSNVPQFSPNTIANAQAIIDSQALTRYNGGAAPSSSTSNSFPPTSQHEQHLQNRIDNLGQHLDKLVAQLPPSFDFSSLQQSNGQQSGNNLSNDNPDDFDFSQYLDNLNDSSEADGGYAFDNSQDLADPLAAYMDPALTGAGTAGTSSAPNPLSMSTQDKQPQLNADQGSGPAAPEPFLVKEEPTIEAAKPVKIGKTAGKQPMKNTGGRGQKRGVDNLSDTPVDGAGRGKRSTRARLGT